MDHCMARLSSSRVVLTGGVEDTYRFWYMDSGMNVLNEFTLPEDRANHACGMARNPSTGTYLKINQAAGAEGSR